MHYGDAGPDHLWGNAGTSGPGGVPVNLHGQNFSPGTVNLWVDAIGGTSLGTATADQTGSFTAASSWPGQATLGAHQILAEAGAQQATAPIWAEGAIQ